MLSDIRAVDLRVLMMLSSGIPTGFRHTPAVVMRLSGAGGPIHHGQKMSAASPSKSGTMVCCSSPSPEVVWWLS